MNVLLRRKLLLSQKKFKNQYSYLFDGVDERININSVGTALATTTKGTWSYWVNPVDATPTTVSMLITFANGDGTDLIQTYINTNGTITINCVDDNVTKWQINTTSAPLSDNTWAHIALVQDATSPVLYVNSVVPAQSFPVSINKTIWFNNLVMNNVRLACRFWNATEGDGKFPFNGNIDEVGFFNTNLTAGQITEIYNNGKPKNLLKHSAINNLVSYFRFDKDSFDGTNFTVVDSKGTNNGTSVNMEFADKQANVP